jgi:hypothetical protein
MARRDSFAVGRFFDCEGCKMTSTPEQRQSIGCGWEPPPPEHVDVRVWDHPGRPETKDDKTTICPGYSCGLPEVIEASVAQLHWSKGELEHFTRGQLATPDLLRAIVTLEVEQARAKAYALDNPPKKDD